MKKHKSVLFSTLTISWSHHCYLVPENSHHPKRGPLSPWSVTPQSLATKNPLSVNLPVPDICYKWSHTLWVLVCLESHGSPCGQVHPHCNMCQRFTAFCGWVIVQCVDGPRSVYPATHSCSLEWFLPEKFVNSWLNTPGLDALWLSPALKIKI